MSVIDMDREDAAERVALQALAGGLVEMTNRHDTVPLRGHADGRCYALGGRCLS